MSSLSGCVGCPVTCTEARGGSLTQINLSLGGRRPCEVNSLRPERCRRRSTLWWGSLEQADVDRLLVAVPNSRHAGHRCVAQFSSVEDADVARVKDIHAFIHHSDDCVSQVPEGLTHDGWLRMERDGSDRRMRKVQSA